MIWHFQHHGRSTRDPFHRAKIVRDEHIGEPEILLQSSEKLQDLLGNQRIEVGSSQMIKSGSAASARAMHTRCSARRISVRAAAWRNPREGRPASKALQRAALSRPPIKSMRLSSGLIKHNQSGGGDGMSRAERARRLELNRDCPLAARSAPRPRRGTRRS